MHQEPLSNTDYQKKKRFFRLWQFRFGVVLAAALLVVIGIPSHGAFGWFDRVAAGILVLVALGLVGFELVDGGDYFSEKRRQGFKIGPYTATPRSRGGSD